MKLTAELTDDAVLTTLGERIARQRIEANLTQATLAKEAGVSKSTVERLEAGAGCELTKLIRVLRVLKLIEGSTSSSPSCLRARLPSSNYEANSVRERVARRQSAAKRLERRGRGASSSSWRPSLKSGCGDGELPASPCRMA